MSRTLVPLRSRRASFIPHPLAASAAAAYTPTVATIRIHPSGERFATSPVRSLLNTLLAEGFPIDTVCGGLARCGRCLVQVRDGAGFLSAPTPRELERLASLGAGPGHRLACQVYARGDVEIEVINIRGAARR